MDIKGIGLDSRTFATNLQGYFNSGVVAIPTVFGGGYFSTELVVVGFAILLSRIFLVNGIFDIRLLGFIYSAVLAFSIFMIVISIRKKWNAAGWMAAVFMIFIFLWIGKCFFQYLNYDLGGLIFE